MLCATVPSCHDDESVYFRQTQASTVSCGIFHKSLSQRIIEYTNYPYKLPNIQNFLLVFIIWFAQLELLLLSSAPLPPTKIEESPTNILYCVSSSFTPANITTTWLQDVYNWHSTEIPYMQLCVHTTMFLRWWQQEWWNHHDYSLNSLMLSIYSA